MQNIICCFTSWRFGIAAASYSRELYLVDSTDSQWNYWLVQYEIQRVHKIMATKSVCWLVKN